MSRYILDLRLDSRTIEEGNFNEYIQHAYDTLHQNGFTKLQGCVYIGDKSVDAVACVLVAQTLGELCDGRISFFKMYRIEEESNLLGL